MLGLQLPTDPRWANLAAYSLEEILTDHAFCEQKAASTMISIIQLHNQRPKIVNELAPIVTEEWGHFRMVLNEINKRGFTLGPQRKDEYVNALFKFIRKGGSITDRLIEQLLMCALIEARSCERFKMLHENLEDEYLRNFYYKFMVSEAGHYRLFLDLAKHYKPENEVILRWKEWLAQDKEILSTLHPRPDRLH